MDAYWRKAKDGLEVLRKAVEVQEDKYGVNFSDCTLEGLPGKLQKYTDHIDGFCKVLEILGIKPIRSRYRTVLLSDAIENYLGDACDMNGFPGLDMKKFSEGVDAVRKYSDMCWEGYEDDF